MVWRCFAANGAGAVFHVYDRHALDRPPRRYVVGAGDRIDGEWHYDADGRYDLWVLGPNGFHRHFAGQQGEPVPAVAWTIGDTGLALTVPHGNPGLRLIRLTPVAARRKRRRRPVAIFGRSTKRSAGTTSP